jgi:hypothetical protein
MRTAISAICRLFFVACLAGSSAVLGGCSTIEGYPQDPEDSSAVLKALQPYFAANSEDAYYAATSVQTRQAQRDTIVLHRIHAYDLEFDCFEETLNGTGNGASTGGDLLVLLLNGLGATTGSSATKAALAAASAGVVGAQGAINKDLYYTKTLPALLAQMEANRAKIKVALFAGLSLSDTQYSLGRADLDLESLKMAGSIPAAVTQISQAAATSTQQSQAATSGYSTTTYSITPTSQRIVAWLYPGGKDTDASGNAVSPTPANLTSLVNWMQADTSDPTLAETPWIVLVRGSDANGRLETDRQQAISALNIP